MLSGESRYSEQALGEESQGFSRWSLGRLQGPGRAGQVVAVTSLVPVSQETPGAGPRQERPDDWDEHPGHGQAGRAGKGDQAGLGTPPPQLASATFTLDAVPPP